MSDLDKRLKKLPTFWVRLEGDVDSVTVVAEGISHALREVEALTGRRVESIECANSGGVYVLGGSAGVAK